MESAEPAEETPAENAPEASAASTSASTSGGSTESSAADSSELAEGAEGGEAPYKNLFVPLVLVPAAIVATILFVFVMFSAVTGGESSLQENVQKVMTGGQNERDQALLQLVRQLELNREAKAKGEELPYPVEGGFTASLRKAWESLPPEDVALRFVVATALMQNDPEEGPEKLLELAQLDEELDPEGDFRFKALLNLGSTGDPTVRPQLIRSLSDPDRGLRAVAAVALQRIPGEETAEALAGALLDEDFDVKANAALSLSHFADPRAADTLRWLTEEETYTQEHARDEARFGKAERISSSRAQAVHALARLKRSEDRPLLEALAADGSDLIVKSAALEELGQW